MLKNKNQNKWLIAFRNKFINDVVKLNVWAIKQKNKFIKALGNRFKNGGLYTAGLIPGRTSNTLMSNIDFYEMLEKMQLSFGGKTKRKRCKRGSRKNRLTKRCQKYNR
uniref:Uncharacterized protein n=1 Tax=viral metagenome TaxID=1070528 RepID=A0A6C0I505_9ZZZZ